MANWIDDPQGREEVEKVTQELKLPIFKPNAKGKFRPWLTEVWGKIEDYLINLKNIVNEKEPTINKKSGFNLDKTNLTENDSNKLFTAKGALDLFNTLTTNFTNAVNTAKEYFRTELVKKIDKTSISDSLNSTSTTTVLSSAGAKVLEDKKFNKNGGILSGNLVMGTGNRIVGAYNYGYSLLNSKGEQKYLAYLGEDGKINIGYPADRTPINFGVAPTIKGENIWTSENFNPDDKLDKIGGIVNGNLSINGVLTAKGSNTIIGAYNYGYSLADAKGTPRYFAYINPSNVLKIGYPEDNVPIDFGVVPTINSASIWTSENFNPTHHLGADYGGILNTAGTKTAGKTYWDNNTKKLFLCKNNNSDTSANVNNYIALDNKSLLENFNTFLKPKTLFERGNPNYNFNTVDVRSYDFIQIYSNLDGSESKELRTPHVYFFYLDKDEKEIRICLTQTGAVQGNVNSVQCIVNMQNGKITKTNGNNSEGVEILKIVGFKY